LERAAAAEEEEMSRPVKLSNFEDALATATLDDLSTEALEHYHNATEIKEPVLSELFNRRLLQQGLLNLQSGHYVPTGFGLLLFGKTPRIAMPQAGLLATIFYPDGREEPRDFDGPMVMIPEGVEQWLRDKLPNTIDRSHMKRRTTQDLPFELLREAVVNALVHRDYDIVGAKCQLIVMPDTITIKSPGGPLPPITLKQLQDFNAPMLSRNPRLHYVFSQMGLAEERGLGLRTLRSIPQKTGLPLPTYSFDDPYLTLTLYRNSEGASRALPAQILDALNKDEKTGWEFLSSRTSTTKDEYAGGLGFDDRKAQRHLKKFVDVGLLRRVGAGPATRYEVVRP
jgi:ATP-dependent DNA helicase RecG